MLLLTVETSFSVLAVVGVNGLKFGELTVGLKIEGVNGKET